MQTVDARGKSCPMPIVLVSIVMRSAAPGEQVVVRADDRAFPEDLRAWCQKTGCELISLDYKPGFFEAHLQKP